MSNSINDLTPKQLRRAAELKEKIEALQNELGKLLSGTAKPATASKPKKRKKRNISPEGLARISAAQKSRWAKKKAAKK